MSDVFRIIDRFHIYSSGTEQVIWMFGLKKIKGETLNSNARFSKNHR